MDHSKSQEKRRFSIRYKFLLGIFLLAACCSCVHKITQKLPLKRDFLITGCARSGTTYISHLLQKCGMEIGHEKTLKDGVCSWVMCIHAKTVPWAMDPRAKFRFNHIFHQVRNPLKVIASAQTEGPPSWKYIIKHIPEIKWEDPLVVKSAKYWYYWNLKAEAQAEWTYRIEDIDQVWDEFCRRLGRKLDRAMLKEVPNTTNSRSHSSLTWNDLEKQLAPELYQNIRLLAQKYGYPVE